MFFVDSQVIWVCIYIRKRQLCEFQKSAIYNENVHNKTKPKLRHAKLPQQKTTPKLSYTLAYISQEFFTKFWD